MKCEGLDISFGQKTMLIETYSDHGKKAWVMADLNM